MSAEAGTSILVAFAQYCSVDLLVIKDNLSYCVYMACPSGTIVDFADLFILMPKYNVDKLPSRRISESFKA
jgi:hypothetical protein